MSHSFSMSSAAALPKVQGSPLRGQITEACRVAEHEWLPSLLEQARMAPDVQKRSGALARSLVEGLRGKRARSSGVDALMK